jgi:hypothetical protein
MIGAGAGVCGGTHYDGWKIGQTRAFDASYELTGLPSAHAANDHLEPISAKHAQIVSAEFWIRQVALLTLVYKVAMVCCFYINEIAQDAMRSSNGNQI